MPELLNIALSGLLTHQRGLATTGHNITNAATPGYSRQSNIDTSRVPEFSNGLFIGNGVDVASIERAADEFILSQLRGDTSVLKESEILRGQLDQLDALFANNNTGLNQSLQRFFAAFHAANDDPTSIPARQVVLSEAESLVNRFHTLGTTINEQTRATNGQIETVVSEITRLGEQIATLNRNIVSDLGRGFGQQPNDLLDQRDEVLRQLSELVSISTTDQGNGAINVFIGTGSVLVLGGDSVSLVTQPGLIDPNTTELALFDGVRTVSLSNSVTGGVLGGLLQARDSELNNASNALGRISVALAATVNQQQRLGMDLNGALGIDLFSDVNSATAIAGRTLPARDNSVPSDHVVAVSIADPTQLEISDYRLTFTSATDYVLTRTRDGVSNGAIDASLTGTIGGLPATLTFDGLSMDLDRPSGNFVAGDSFLLKPFGNAAADIELNIGQPEQIALASPVRTAANINNAGTAVISSGVVTDTTAPLFATPGQLSPPLLISFTSATTYDILDNSTPGAPVPLVPPQSGLTFPAVPANSILPASFGVQLAFSGQPATGDAFTLDFNTNGFQDNRNGLAVANLQTDKILDGGRTSLQDAYGRLLQEVGTAASQARFNEEAATGLLQQTEARRSEVSGVNLDEEAAKLIELQQAYGAAAQVINVARSTFDSLLNALN